MSSVLTMKKPKLTALLVFVGFEVNTVCEGNMVGINATLNVPDVEAAPKVALGFSQT